MPRLDAKRIAKMADSALGLSHHQRSDSELIRDFRPFGLQARKVSKHDMRLFCLALINGSDGISHCTFGAMIRMGYPQSVDQFREGFRITRWNRFLKILQQRSKALWKRRVRFDGIKRQDKRKHMIQFGYHIFWYQMGQRIRHLA